MSRKATSGKVLTANELVGTISDVIRNLKNGTVEPKEANSINSAARTICQIAKTQMQVIKFQKENPESRNQKILE